MREYQQHYHHKRTLHSELVPSHNKYLTPTPHLTQFKSLFIKFDPLGKPVVVSPPTHCNGIDSSTSLPTSIPVVAALAINGTNATIVACQ